MSQPLKIFIAEDEPSLRTVLKNLFSKKGFEVVMVANGRDALQKLREEYFQVAVVDIKMPGLSGLDLLETLKKERCKTQFILITAQDTMKHAVEAMKRGAYDYIAKPFELEELEVVVQKAFETQKMAEELKNLKEVLKAKTEKENKIIGKSRAVREIYKTIGKVAAADVAILLMGESGTGKELVAKAIHQNSTRWDGPFVAVNCAAIPRDLLESELFGYKKGAFTGAEENRIGFFEKAEKGTLFLDEIGELPLNLQAKLLRVLQEKEIQPLGSSETKSIDVRILSATNRNLEKMVQEKTFREDLFFRLNIIPIRLPPLSERKEDIPLLCDYFLQRLAEEAKIPVKSVSAPAMELLSEYAWPGNIRELENVLKRAAILSVNMTLQLSDFSFFIGKKEKSLERQMEEVGLEELVERRLQPFVAQLSVIGEDNLYEKILQMAERPLIRLLLEKTGYNQIQTAKILGINRNTLRSKMKQLKIPGKGSA